MDIDAEQVIGPFKIIGGTLGKGEMWLHKAAFTKSGEDEFIFPYQVYRNSNLVSYKEVSRRVDRRYANTMKEALFSFAWLTRCLWGGCFMVYRKGLTRTRSYATI